MNDRCSSVIVIAGEKEIALIELRQETISVMLSPVFTLLRSRCYLSIVKIVSILYD
jgi:hypothetical protein